MYIHLGNSIECWLHEDSETLGTSLLPFMFLLSCVYTISPFQCAISSCLLPAAVYFVKANFGTRMDQVDT